MRIKHKLWLGFGLILVLFSALSLYLNSQLGVIGNTVSRVMEHPLNAVYNSRTASEIFRDSHDLVLTELAAIQFSDGRQSVVQLNNLKSDFLKHIDQAEQAAMAMGSSFDFVHTRQLAQRWYELNVQRIGDVNQAKIPDERLLTQLDRELQATLSQLVQQNIALVQTERQKTSDEISSTQSTAVTVMLLVLAIGIVMAFLLSLNIQKPLLQLQRSVENLAKGEADLTQRLNLTTRDETGDLARELDLFIGRIHELLINTKASVTTSCEALLGLTEIASGTREGAIEQKQAMVMTEYCVKDMTSAVQQMNDFSHHAKGQADTVNHDTQQSIQMLQQSSDGIVQLSGEVSAAREEIQLLAEDSNSISSLINVIDEIAEQTNLLALNAAIEAARAGEAGRGFAVVADEVRALASKTRESTENIRKTIGGIQDKVSSARNVMEHGRDLALRCVEQSGEVNESLNAVGIKVQEISDINGTIATQSHEQTSTMQNIGDRMALVNTVASETEQRTADLQEVREQLAEALTAVECYMSEFRL